jgi:hypothetical protein
MIIGMKIHSTKMEDMKLLKTMLAEMNANMKSNQEKWRSIGRQTKKIC